MVIFENNLFHLSTEKTSYIIGVMNGQLIHLYWGKKLSHLPDFEMMLPQNKRNTLSASDMSFQGHELSTDSLTMEYPTFGSADLRNPSFHAQYKDGSTVTALRYDSFEVITGKPEIPGLPATYSEEGDDVETLKIKLKDELTGICVTLVYSLFVSLDAITRSAIVENNGNETVALKSVLSANVDFRTNDYDFIHLYGGWARERIPQRVPLFNGKQQVESVRGASSAHHNPFFALVSKNATERDGDAYGFNLVYSGNFTAGAESDPCGISRAYIGMNPFDFSWQLDPGKSFYSPEAVLVYSDQGIGEMSRIFHRLYRTRLCRGKFRDRERYVLINNWEATYFSFTEDKILDIAKKASQLGVELMVLDDGWFGKRNDDYSSLGDWYVNTDKLPSGITGLAQKIEEMDMKFGLWFEPEMVSPESDLYHAHPDWCIHVKDRQRHEDRHQLILDLTRRDVRDYIKGFLDDMLGSAKVSYVKWDMNRNMTEVGSALLDAAHQGEIYHRYILGLYEILEYITAKYPEVLFEGCASGGGRFDAGILYYMPQIWTSDDSDAVERLYIQYGTSVCYPYSTMGAHVSAVPNHQVGRTTPLALRGDVALCGQFGYELDLNKLTEAEAAVVKQQIALYKQLGPVFHRGDLYRLHTPDLGDFVANEFVSEDRQTVVLCTETIKGTPNAECNHIMLDGLEKDAVYISEDGREYYGEALMSIGLRYEARQDYSSNISIFRKKQQAK